MSHRNLRYYRPELETLEGRRPPSSLHALLDAAGRGRSDEAALLRTLETVVFPAASQAASAAQQDAHGNPNPGVLPPQSHPFGMTYGQWEGAFWKWALSLDADHNP